VVEPEIEVRSLREQVYEHLKRLMNGGRLRAGHFLDLNGLAREIGISRTPLRDALLRLESEGFVEILPRRGVRISELTPERIRHLYEIVGSLEATALRSVGARITPRVVARMREINDDMAQALDAADFDRFYDANLAFHDTYLKLSENGEMVQRIRILKERLYDFPRLQGFLLEWERASVNEHRRLVELLEEGRLEAAADFLRDVHWSFPVQEHFILRYYRAGYGIPAAPDD
jgi:DNA-binding GntR family transcriptional regulator